MAVTDHPHTARGDVLDQLHGESIADPYRWLEDPDAPETVDWVRRQNEVSQAYLGGLEEHGWFLDTMTAVVHRPRGGVPRRRGGHYFVSRNDGSQNQDVWYVAGSLPELLAGGRLLVDPNTFSADGSDSLTGCTVSSDGHYFAYTLSEGGSDWVTFVLLDVATGMRVEDAEIQTKFSEPTWLPDSRSFLYVDFAHEGHAAGTQTGAVGGGRLRLHRVGRPQADDPVVLEFPDNDQLMVGVEVSEDDQYVVATIVEGTENRNRLWVYPIGSGDDGSTLGEPVKLVDEPNAEWVFVRSAGSSVFLQTDLEAPRGRVVRVDLADAGCTPLPLADVVPEGPDALVGVVAAGEVLLTAALEDARPRLSRFGLDGARLGDLDVSGGSVVALNARAGDAEVFVGFSFVTSPTTTYRVDVETGEVRALPELVPAAAGGAAGEAFRPPEVTVERRHATSADGTPVPYFLVSPAGLDTSRPQPTLLYGYGGFKIPVLLDYRPAWSAWLAAGGVLAVANLRGGGEYGTDWYEDGRLANKQHVFDDFIAVGEHLVSSGVTRHEQLALHGASNGGLLVGAVMTQRPDLAAVALPAVGVLDLLRYHLFTIGAAWMSDYGDPGDPEQFRIALAYSPLHNVRPGTHYPATLVLTGDHDDRVVPLHSHKFTATLQHAQAGEAPVLAFAAHHTGLQPH